MKKALISGISGQDGSYLAELLLEKGYLVYGIARRTALESFKERYGRINHILKDVKLLSGDIQNYARVYEIINEVKPDELYHLAALSFVKTSFEDEFTVLRTNSEGTVNILNCLRKIKPDCKFYFSGSSEMFGKVTEVPQTEQTPFHPRSPYGISKCTGFYYTRFYREAYNMFCCSGILFNHEGPRRGEEFVTRKISKAVARIKLGKQKVLKLGNIDAKRDWGFSKEYVYAMYLMLQHSYPDDYIIATGETHSIKEFLEEAFSYVGLNWKGYVEIDKKFFRPSDVNLLIGDYSKAARILKWKPKTTFKELVRLMVKNDLQKQKNNS